MNESAGVHEVTAADLAGLRARLRALGRTLGVTVTVTDADEWVAAPDEVRVGLNFYAARGHGPEEAVALSIVELWTVFRFARVAPERVRRRATIARLHKDLVPLLSAIDHLQAAGELLTVMPAIRAPLGFATLRRVPASLQELPRHLQWIAMLLRNSLVPGAEVVVDEHVAAELSRLNARGGESDDVLRRLMMPAEAGGQLRHLEHALAAFLPPYRRLLARDLSDRGMGETSPGSPEHADQGTSEEGLGVGAGESQKEAEISLDSQSDEAPAQLESEAARSAEQQDASEGSDLFAAEQAAFVSKVLSTPMPAQGVLIEALLDVASDDRTDSLDSERADSREVLHGGGGASAVAMARLAEYRDRVAHFSPAIAEMRDVWQRVVSSRIATRRSVSRRAYPEGELLNSADLARTVSEVVSGVARPAAFLKREARDRRAQRAGNTDYLLLLDRSASMQGWQAEAAADAALVMLEALAGVERDIHHAEQASGLDLDLSVRTALIVFDAVATVVKPLAGSLSDDVRRELHAHVRSVRGSTNDAAALHAAAVQLGVSGARPDENSYFLGSGAVGERDGVERTRIVILVSDGGSNDTSAAAQQTARLKAAGVHVWGIALGNDEVVRRFAPASRRVQDARFLAAALLAIVEQELPE